MSSGVAAAPEQWRRVATAVRDRRNALGLTQEAAAARAIGASPVIWRLIENGRQDAYKARTLTAVCRSLGWTPDSIDRILAGEPPQIAGEPSADKLDQVLAELADLRTRIERLEAAAAPGPLRLAADTGNTRATVRNRGTRPQPPTDQE